MDTPQKSNNPSMNKPPEGKYTTSAVLYTRTNSDGATQFDDQIITSAKSGIFTLKADVMAKDVFTGEIIRLDGIRVKTDSSMVSTGYAPGQKFELICVSYEAFRRGQIDQMELLKCPETPVIHNPAIPQPAVIKNTVNGLIDSNTAQCATFNQKYNALKRKLGLVHDRDDIVIYGNGQNGRAPGVIVHKADGSLVAYDNAGKQYTHISPQYGISENAIQIDTGTSDLASTDYMGRHMKYNKVNESIPQGTILCPSPMSLPNLTKILSLIQTVTDFADLISTCTRATKAFMNDDADTVNDIMSELNEPTHGDIISSKKES